MPKGEAEIILNIFSKFDVQFYAFGSRITNDFWRFSDLDICYDNPLSLLDLGDLKEMLDLSNLTIKVDLVDLSNCSLDFRNAVLRVRQPLAPENIKEV